MEASINKLRQTDNIFNTKLNSHAKRRKNELTLRITELVAKCNGNMMHSNNLKTTNWGSDMIMVFVIKTIF
jgi:hypothetical protein